MTNQMFPSLPLMMIGHTHDRCILTHRNEVFCILHLTFAPLLTLLPPYPKSHPSCLEAESLLRSWLHPSLSKEMEERDIPSLSVITAST